ncbi:SMP-30/gluconolactonase/LRE family protein [Burkholderia anthina]|uniref:SMP-30/gluconolactonase/LRE family protein n=1 Tax=Burkholderia anthina TaxID=179879 RepID=UPI00158F4E91|nr:SMP-30/gluconolactonase/LRE family protein [Burkholderia anthina]
MKERQAALLADDFVFLEAPRWRHDRLWVSDVFDYKLYCLHLDGSRAIVCEVPQRPSGIGFLPDGTPIVVSSKDRRLMKVIGNALSTHADLSSVATGDLNDLVVDDLGRIYVGNFGYDLFGGQPKALTDLHLVEPDGSMRVVASDLDFPNGAVLTNGGRTLVVAETWSCRLTAFERDSDGSLSGRRSYADLGNRMPDGICVDAEGGIWVSSFNTGEFFRVLDGGEVTDRVSFDGRAIACHLGGENGTTLFCCTYTGTLDEIQSGKRAAMLHTVQVDVPSATFA